MTDEQVDYELINPIVAPNEEEGPYEQGWNDVDPESLDDAEVEALVDDEIEAAISATGDVVAGATKYVILNKARYNRLVKKYRHNKKKIAAARKRGKWAYIRRVRAQQRKILAELKKLKRPAYGAAGALGPAPGFSWKEFSCHDGTPVPTKYRPNVALVAKNLNTLRAVIKHHYTAEQVSVHINSAYRTPHYNASIGGVSNSQHLIGKAADICVYVKKNGVWKQVPIPALAAFAAQVPRFNNGGIGVYVRLNFVHVDVRPYKARWVG